VNERPRREALPAGDVACAFCDSTDTEMIALFGGFLLASQYYCNGCHTVFEVVRWKEDAGAKNGSNGEGD
jgi:hypothetical protein